MHCQEEERIAPYGNQTIELFLTGRLQALPLDPDQQLQINSNCTGSRSPAPHLRTTLEGSNTASKASRLPPWMGLHCPCSSSCSVPTTRRPPRCRSLIPLMPVLGAGAVFSPAAAAAEEGVWACWRSLLTVLVRVICPPKKILSSWGVAWNARNLVRCSGSPCIQWRVVNYFYQHCLFLRCRSNDEILDALLNTPFYIDALLNTPFYFVCLVAY
eukprot:1156875-Pelagomonas_calceolata.AAC.5